MMSSVPNNGRSFDIVRTSVRSEVQSATPKVSGETSGQSTADPFPREKVMKTIPSTEDRPQLTVIQQFPHEAASAK